MKKLTISRRTAWVLLCLFLLVAGFAGWRLLGVVRGYQAGASTYREVAALAPLPATLSGGEEAATTAPAFPTVDHGALQAINADYLAWLTVPGTDIHYPVVQGEDNDRYLTRLFDGTENRAGCLFLEAQNSAALDDRHSIIYGHNMKDGSMFSRLVAYEDAAFAAAHPTAQLMTPQGNYKVIFFAGYVAAATDTAWELSFADEAAFAAWCSEQTARSTFAAPEKPAGADRVLTLSTCAYHFEDARFVLHGWLVEAE